MQFRGVYVLWFLLPFIYGCLTIWALMRPYFKVSGQEKVRTYSGGFLYTAICFAIAIFLDQLGIINPLAQFLGGQGYNTEDSQVNIIRFLIFPLVLVVGAQLQQLFRKEKQGRKLNLPKSKWDM